MKNNSRKTKIFQAALFAVSIGLLVYFCVSDNNLMLLADSLPRLNTLWLVGACCCVVLNWVMDGRIIQCLVGHGQEESYTFRQAFKVTMVGQYFNSITPYAVAGQPMQLVSLIRQGAPSGAALSALVRKFLVYQTVITGFSLLVILVKFQFFQQKIQGFMALAVIGFVYQAAIVAILALFTYSPRFTTKLIGGIVWLLTRIRLVKDPQQTSKNVQDQLQFYIESNKAMKDSRALTARVYGCTLVQLTALFSIPFFIYKAFRLPGMPLTDMIAAQSFVTMISSYTPLPGAAGAAEGSFLVLFQMFFSNKIIRQAMLLWRLIAYYSCILVGAFFAGLDGRREKQKSGSGRMNGSPVTEKGVK